ncbi:MAG: 16S rRNA (cytidine(1402)-2'-O)-methyltransferase [Chloroflexi bacterium]|nr:16S rRNA (cytidine(1402)-2'-O)-methyltransferase [Chloroflexota bacterium]
MNTLYVVATPIGNLEDVTLRALRLLREVSLVAAEDTRTTRKLLSHHGIRQRLLSYNEHNMRSRTPRILDALGSSDVALVSEAGTPGISDPGYELVVAAVEAGCPVVPVPGPSAVTAALAVSGLPSRQFTYVGFLPRRAGERRRLLASLSAEPRTIVTFEAPHRLRRTLADMLAAWGDRRIAVCRELTKAFEEVFRGTISQALEHFGQPRGELTLVIEGASTAAPPLLSEDEVRSQLRRLRAQGVPAREAVSAVASSSGLPRRQVYRLWLETPPIPHTPEQ